MEHVLAWVHSPNLHGWDGDIIGYVASALVIAAFSMRSMRSLRITAITSNLAFIAYAYATDMRPILLLHSILLPVNVFRFAQMQHADRCDRTTSFTTTVGQKPRHYFGRFDYNAASSRAARDDANSAGVIRE